ncbi:MAG: DNA gyrase subunit A, partial [Gammaproteobacteria bacterium]|nr:DNA gyrase subunit A [Gammaproteobacteria bacterium]
EIILKIEELLEILRNPERLREVIREELEAIRDQYGEPRRTEISADYSNLSQEDLIPETDMVVTLSHEGYIKAQPLDDYQTQRRGGRGKSATSMKDNDFIDKLFVASSHDMCLFFTSRGRVYWRKVYQLPAASRGSKGRPIINVLPLQENERVNTTLAVRDFPDDQFVFFATRNGVVKKTALSAFSRPLASGIIAVDLRQDDYLVKVDITDGTKDVMLISADGQAMRFNENDVRAMGRTAAGVRGIRLKNAEDHVVALIVCDDDSQVLTATEMGNGKRTHITEYPCKGRGGQGVIDIKTEDRNGKVIGAVKVAEDADVMLITNGGTLVRTKVAEVREVSRNTYGVSLIRLTKGEKLVEIAAVPFTETDEEEPVEGNEPIDGDAGASAGANTQASEDTSEPPTSEGDDA